jgi:hypothetical protein
VDRVPVATGTDMKPVKAAIVPNPSQSPLCRTSLANHRLTMLPQWGQNRGLYVDGLLSGRRGGGVVFFDLACHPRS